MGIPEIIPPRLGGRRAELGVVVVEIAGDWSGRKSLPGIGPVKHELAVAGATAVRFEATELSHWDSALLARILDIGDLCEKANVEFRADTLPDGLAKLVALAKAVRGRADAAREVPRNGLLQTVGEWGLNAWNGGAEMLGFLGEGAVALLSALRGRAQFRWSDTLTVIHQCGPGALGIVALINFLMGLILAFVGATELTQFGASIYTADLVAIATVREMACIMTAIIVCGRTGAAFAAQLGTMKVTQEVEAFKTFGISPFEFLVLPRMLALIFMMPLLCVFADLISIAGGFVVSTLMLDMTPELYVNRTLEAISLANYVLGISKGAVFGVVVALAGCLRGMQCGPNAAAVGDATTSAVVTGITWIIALDGLFAVICNALRI